MSDFKPGQRVMIKDWGADPVISKLDGYYGHVTDQRSSLPDDNLLHWVRIAGRAGGSAHPAIMSNPLWPFNGQACPMTTCCIGFVSPVELVAQRIPRSCPTRCGHSKNTNLSTPTERGITGIITTTQQRRRT